MKKIVVLSMTVFAISILAGCSHAVKVSRFVAPSSTVAIVPFADCPTGTFNDCPGSGQKVTAAYAQAFNASVVSASEGSKFDVLITGKLTEYNKATPFLRPNVVAVDLKVADKNGGLIATQVDEASRASLGSVENCSKELADRLKYYLGFGKSI
jgi:hypothetical protein